MNLNRARTAALSAAAVLILGGAGTALAQNPAVPASAPASAPVVPVSDPTGDVQQGDQAAPDLPTAESATEAPETAAEATTTTAASEAVSAEADGPGGHQDADGQNVDHQFQGEE
jgi:riboflavin biosynthesis pyrimidine reductase